ncbi:DUF924 family protein [Diaphorobacter aerolatus]|uniref:DUF924 domain-containing protein n=1 Tax=Diaphorobacter aerolatus TaxID=1288495 RepID=A0A7H0GGY8_9BURK|nr:DUF924 family protein [Diaphorobacter aerolatus]QNP47554.1 DUF924 domain-containing protein [Diaphorobacter aerolatus]
MTPAHDPTAQTVIRFWFEESTPQQWFTKDAAFDDTIRKRFGAVLEIAARGELWKWRGDALGRLAEIIVLDQFSRNVWRDTPKAFAQDGMALVLSQEVIALGLDRDFTEAQRAFTYMPLMHSESLMVQDESIRQFTALGNPVNLDFAERHREIVQRFGRYPHRNAVLGRESTKDEQAFLQTPGSSF